MSDERRAHTKMVLATVLIATAFPVVASVAGELDSVLLTLLRFGLASVLFLPLVLLRHGRAALPSASALARYGTLSLLNVAFFTLMFEAMRTTSAVNTGALVTFGPGFSALFAFVLVRERLGRGRLAALLAGMLGALWVVFRGDPARVLALDLAVGDGYFVVGTASFGLYAVLVKRLHRGEPMAVMTLWTLITGTGWLLLAGGGELARLDWGAVAPRVYAALAYLALFTTLITFSLTQSAVTVIGPTRTMAYNYVNPSLVALLAWLLGDGAIGWRSLPGIGLTVLSMLVLQREGSRNSTGAGPDGTFCPPVGGEVAATEGASTGARPGA